MKLFNNLVYEQLKSDRNILVVDNLHGYARIAQRLRYLWDGLCLVGEDNLTKEGILACLVGIASVCQRVAESLGLVDEQEEAIADDKDRELKAAKEALWSILVELNKNMKSVSNPSQLGTTLSCCYFEPKRVDELYRMMQDR
jgi:hypothetical protein